MLQFQYLPGYIGATLMLCLLLGMLAVPALRESHRNVAVKSKTRFWLVFAFFAAIATIHGGGKTNNTQCASAPARIRSVMPAPATSSSVTNEFAVLPPLEASSVQRDEFSFGGTFTWRGAEGVPSATTIDILAAWPTLTNKWKWVGCADVLGPVVSQQWRVATYQLGVDQMPRGLFVKFKERSTSASTMDDWDGDLLPGVYEVANQTNPYVSDFNDAPKLTVGSKGQYATLQAAFTAARPYSIVQLPSDQITQASEVVMPPYPVMVVGPTNGYARISSSGMPYAFAFQDGQDYETIFQNIYLDLLPSSSMRVGFWCGGDLPTYSHYPAASATFRNVYLRESGSNGRGFGWFFRRWHSSPAFIENCVLNAEGSSNFIGISAIDAPNLSISNCTFVNFPKMDVDGQYGVAIQIENTGYQDQSTTTTVANCVFDNSFTNAYPLGRLGEGYVINAENCILPQDFVGVHRPDSSVAIVYASNSVAWTGHAIAGSVADEMGIGALAAVGEASTLDSDNDGLTDWEEIYRYCTDPFKADTDGDKLNDAVEVLNMSDPLSALDFAFQASIELPVVYLTNENVWVSFGGQYSYPILVETFAENVVMPICHVTNGVVPQLVLSNQYHSVECRFPVADFPIRIMPPDSDNDQMDDFWELAAGLCPMNPSDATEDLDGDYLINLHEYWTGCNPLIPDGTNTAISLATRSIDELIDDANIQSADCFSYYSKVGADRIAANEECWASKFLLNSQSPTNSTGGTCRSGTAISRRHIVFANHFSITNNSMIYFYGGESAVITNKLLASMRVFQTDIRIGILESELDTNVVNIAGVMPPRYDYYLGNCSYLPCIAMNQTDDCLLMEVSAFSGGTTVTKPKIGERQSFWKKIRSGDSGDPVFLLLGMQPVILFEMQSPAYSYEGVSGPFISNYLEEIQRVMDVLSVQQGVDRESLVPIDLTIFETLPNWRPNE